MEWQDVITLNIGSWGLFRQSLFVTIEKKETPPINLPMHRREFFNIAAAGTVGLWFSGCRSLAPSAAGRRGPRTTARVKGAFFYPPASVVEAGKCEDVWAPHRWFTWPGNQFQPERQQALFSERITKIAAAAGVDVALEPTPLYTAAAIQGWYETAAADRPDALLLINFWNTFSAKLQPVLEQWKGPAIVYHPVGASHQLPPEFLRTAPRVQYIHSIENWEAIERGLRAIHAYSAMRQAHLLRVTGKVRERQTSAEPFFGTRITAVPAAEFNDRFDATAASPEHLRLAQRVRSAARRITGITDAALLDAVRAHATVGQMLREFDADAITIECLLLGHRKPCLSFSLNNSALVPCGCENDLNATLTLMLGEACFGRAGFQHNPEFDTENNLYFGAHCTCAIRLQGPDGPASPYGLRPFFHQLPRTPALDVQWTPGSRVTLCKYHSDKKLIDVWGGECLGSPPAPPTGGCATRVLVRFDGVADVCDVYPGPHPVLFCGDFVRQVRVLARLYELDVRGRVTTKA